MCYYFKVKKVINTLEDLKDFALDLGVKLPKNKIEALIVALSGDLGAGKTALTKEVARVLGVRETISSPTFVIMRRYALPKSARHSNFIHIDAYRIEDEDELLRLGWREILSNPENLVFIEWPEKVKGIIPEKHIHIELSHEGENKRSVSLKNKNGKN